MNILNVNVCMRFIQRFWTTQNLYSIKPMQMCVMYPYSIHVNIVTVMIFVFAFIYLSDHKKYTNDFHIPYYSRCMRVCVYTTYLFSVVDK